jgi:hypothetical protein
VVIARQWHNKHFSVATDTDATIEDAVFFLWPLLGNLTVKTFLHQQIDKNNRGAIGSSVLCVLFTTAM